MRLSKQRTANNRWLGFQAYGWTIQVLTTKASEIHGTRQLHLGRASVWTWNDDSEAWSSVLWGYRPLSALSIRSTGIQFPPSFSHDVMEQTDVVREWNVNRESKIQDVQRRIPHNYWCNVGRCYANFVLCEHLRAPYTLKGPIHSKGPHTT